MTFKSFDEFDNFLKENPNFTGVCIVLYPGGKKWYERNYVNGKKHGKMVGWFFCNQKSYEHNYVNGKQHGKQINWHTNGKKSHESNLVNGYRIGLQTMNGETYEAKPNKFSHWYIIVKETL